MPRCLWLERHADSRVSRFPEQVAIAIYTATQLSLLVLISVANAPSLRELGIACQALSFTAGLVMLLVSFLEHTRSRRTSSLLSFYVFITLLFDVVRARTLWLSVQSQLEDVFCSRFHRLNLPEDASPPS